MAKKTSGCCCRLEMLILALILLTIGFSCLIQGIVIQFAESAASWWKFGTAYFAGFLFMGLAKMAKHKSYESCTVHRK